MIEITKDLEIDAGHRLLRHEGKCRHLHGHRYCFSITATAPHLDEVGRVIDFSVIKEVVGGWLDQAWDHGFIAEKGDSVLEYLVDEQLKFYVLNCPPTAENLAAHVLKLCRGELAHRLRGIQVTEVRCWETPTSSARAS